MKDLTKYNFRIDSTNAEKPRILFVLNGKECFRTISGPHKFAEYDLLASLFSYIQTGKTDMKPVPLCFSAIANIIRKDEQEKELTNTYDSMLELYESELLDARNKLDEAVKTISNLTSTLEGFKKSRVSGSSDLSSVLSEDDYWFVMDSLKDYYTMRYSNEVRDSGRKLSLEKILNSNPYNENKILDLQNQLRSAYSKVTKESLERVFNKIGFEAEKVGETHWRVYPKGYSNLAVPVSLSPSDNSRVTENLVAEIVAKVLR